MERQEYDALVRELDYHMDRYYNQDEPEISDYEYDRLMQKLKQAEREHPDWVTPESPSQKIGGEAASEAGDQITHRVPMLSIEDVFTMEDVAAWVDRVQEKHPDALFSVEGKVDGVSLTLRYQRNEADGKLHLMLAETRGNGLVGGDVTANALAMEDVRKELDLDCDYLELRGEVYLTHAAYREYLNEPKTAGEKVAETPRSLAAATLRQLDTEVTKHRKLRMLVFNIQDGPETLMTSHAAGMEQLAALGVPVVMHRLCKSGAEVLDTIAEIGAMRAELPYDMDGAVVKLDRVADRAEFPVGPKYAPGHIAYKFPPDEEH